MPNLDNDGFFEQVRRQRGSDSGFFEEQARRRESAATQPSWRHFLTRRIRHLDVLMLMVACFVVSTFSSAIGFDLYNGYYLAAAGLFFIFLAASAFVVYSGYSSYRLELRVDAEVEQIRQMSDRILELINPPVNVQKPRALKQEYVRPGEEE